MSYGSWMCSVCRQVFPADVKPAQGQANADGMSDHRCYKCANACPECGSSNVWHRFSYGQGRMRHSCGQCNHTWYTQEVKP